MSDNPSESASALQKSMVILGGLLDSDHPMGLGEIAHHTDIPRQTVYRIARQLEDAGLIRRELDGEGYTVGAGLLDISINAIRLANNSLPVRGVLRNLVEQVGETCNVGILDRDQVVYVERVECDWPLRLQFGPGSRVSVHATAIGKLLLAHLPNRTRSRILTSQTLTRYTENTITDLDELDRQFRKIRKSGFASNDQENLMGMVALAVPVVDSRNRVVAGLAIHAARARMDSAQLELHLPKLQAAADTISASINDLMKPEIRGATTTDVAPKGKANE
jgi:IclR family transcriptional regulator, acetate operon repressor